jgi:hypothetical protein
MSEQEKTGGWNYRVMRREYEGQPYYEIVECYYRGGFSYCNASAPDGETRDEVSRDIAWMIKALTLPVLNEKGDEVEDAQILADDLLAAMAGGGPWEKLFSPSEGSA